MDLITRPLTELIGEADGVRRSLSGEALELCGIINAKSGGCPEDCRFCAQSSRYPTGARRYPLKRKREIVEAARRAKEIGAERFSIVTSGNRPTSEELDEIAGAVSEIKSDIGIEPCVSLGALEKSELRMLKSAGLTRYHHNIETSPRFYPRVVTTHSFEERIKTIEEAGSAGLDVCSGGIIGMGESWQDRCDMARLLKELGVSSVPLNFLIPIKGTPLESAGRISSSDAIRTIAIFRIILGGCAIKIAAGREDILRDFQGTGFLAGANGMLIGGYLTVKGRSAEADRRLIDEVRCLWRG